MKTILFFFALCGTLALGGCAGGFNATVGADKSGNYSGTLKSNIVDVRVDFRGGARTSDSKEGP